MDILAQIQALEFPAQLPDYLLELEQSFAATRVDDVGAAVRRALDASGLLARMAAGATVAVGVGSRGIANLPDLVRAAVDRLKAADLQPYIVPAMGSHGGATAEGQIELLASLGITSATMDVEIRATMEVAQIGRIPGGPPLFQGLDSRAADHTLLISRIKPHTDFHGALESGPAKMAVIGLGKQQGAMIMHAGGGANFVRYLAPAAPIYAANTNLAGALCVLENADDETAEVVGLAAAAIGGQPEEALLARARDYMPSLPFADLDVLVVCALGKNISGTGMDPNITGRCMIPRQPENFGQVVVTVIAVLDVTPESHGNATGLGMANVTTARLVRKLDLAAMYTNGVTSGVFGLFRNHIPFVMANDRRAIELAVGGCAMPPEAARIAFIQDTLHLRRLWVSPSLAAAAAARPRVRIVGPVPLSFTAAGALASPWALAES